MPIHIELFTSDESPPGISPERTAKVRKLIMSHDGQMLEKYALSWKTGEWIKIDSGHPYPDECRLKLKQ